MDYFKTHQTGLESPATHLIEVVPSDSAPLAFVTRAVTVEAAGYLQVVTAGGDTGRIFMAAGVPFPLRVTQIMATGTTATGIVGLS
ncbi:spike base protein, RCAP_Rcc01079 family [Jannaschia sp. CCS1]|uniref:spike base protein, RCAP_Rcc01079 family n=1 Tax=Jannaschia sp. (strain CCS1) TaxID=290400 RepID=UPI000053D797|nr:hypothetical protein [Jannaschia sp. CCS1]ABD57175.1 phage-related hypothetical protein [Jannaschia sp. CCS1]